MADIKGTVEKIDNHEKAEICMAGKYYAVRTGKKPGIYQSWDDCKAMVHGYPGAVYKSFKSLAEAEAFLGDIGEIAAGAGGQKAGENDAEEWGRTIADDTAAGMFPEIYAFVDGSYNAATKVYGYGGFLIHHGKKEILQGFGSEEEMASMRNVAGEILGSMAAVRKAIELGIDELTVYYDYLGIEMWATGAWKRNKKGTIAYYEYMQSARQRIALHFVKVKGHSGVDGNEEADRLAKTAVGI